jgi:uncharacterized membrane protein (UPF0127 family)
MNAWSKWRMNLINAVRRFSSFIVFCVAVTFLNANSPGFAEPTVAPQQSGLETLEIVTAGGAHEFSVEVMRTDQQRERGLMFRRFLPPDRGMLFDFGTERPIMMWMKNTYLPLDMIFIARTGKVVGLAENAEPLSEKIIPSRAPAFGVLEVNAGTIAKIGVKIGDSVRHPLFNK